jgi:DNA/RNA endonuclease YhcR with UshA esterase domain
MGTIEAYSSISPSEMIIFVQNPEDIFTLGEYYRFSIRVMDYRTTDEPINDVELLGFSH